LVLLKECHDAGGVIEEAALVFGCKLVDLLVYRYGFLEASLVLVADS
jgi:hypothetical protein